VSQTKRERETVNTISVSDDQTPEGEYWWTPCNDALARGKPKAAMEKYVYCNGAVVY
jgi:hypothetical protein